MAQTVNTPKWDEKTDIIVIGSGFAGLAAAIEAKIAGSSVLILEKMKGYGGNSTISDGAIAAAGTKMQADRGIEDSPQLMYADMLKAGLGLNHPELVRTLTETSNDVFRWTIDYLGVKYLDRVDQFGGHSVARCYTTHNGSGSAIIKQLLTKLKELDVSVRTKAFLQNILKNSDGRVCGVRVRDGYTYPDKNSGVPKTIKARKAVILTTGGFANDIELLRNTGRWCKPSLLHQPRGIGGEKYLLCDFGVSDIVLQLPPSLHLRQDPNSEGLPRKWIEIDSVWHSLHVAEPIFKCTGQHLFDNR